MKKEMQFAAAIAAMAVACVASAAFGQDGERHLSLEEFRDKMQGAWVGQMVNWGDGVWAGDFIGALYAEAYFTDDVDRLLDAGLKAIPSECDYAQMVRNVRAWQKENTDDWTKCREKIRATYAKKFNSQMRDSNGGIDVRLNGARGNRRLVGEGRDGEPEADVFAGPLGRQARQA